MPTLTAPSRSGASVISSSRDARSRAVVTRSSRTSSPPVAASSVGASGVMPTAWTSATEPEEAAAAPSAFIRSSDVSEGRPTIAATSPPASRPSTCPSTG